jgi:hypothetical protein
VNNNLLGDDKTSTPENEENACCSMSNPTSAEEKHYDNNDRGKHSLSFKILGEKWKNYRPAYRKHVMILFGELQGRLEY